MRKRSIKNTRVNTEVQHELSNIIRGGLKDPRVAPWTSVVAAEVAPDLKTCKAYISVLGDAYEQEQTIKGLQSAEGYIRRELARTLNLRNTPEIKFVLDQSIEYGVNMSKKYWRTCPRSRSADMCVRMETVWVPVWDSDSISVKTTVIKPWIFI